MKWIDCLYIKAQSNISKMKNEWKALSHEEEGLDVVVAVVLLAIGLIVASVLAKYASQIVEAAGRQVDSIVP
ncbi:MAG: hypothetical protein ACI4JC_02265 [Faecalibacterium sp.]